MSISDISIIKNAERALKNNEQILKGTIEATADGILVIDKNRKTINANKRFFQLWKMPKKAVDSWDDETMLRSVLDQFKEPEKFYKKIMKIYAEPITTSFQINFKDERTYEAFTHPLLIDEEVEGRVWSFRDITEQKQNEKKIQEMNEELELRVKDRTEELECALQNLYDREEELVRSEELFKGAFETAAHGMVLADTSGCFVKVNNAFTKIVGYNGKELLCKHFKDITYPDDVKLDSSYVKKLLKGEIPSFQIEKRYNHKKGNVVWVNLNVALIRDFEGKPLQFVAQMIDITERKRAEEELNQSMGFLNSIIENIPLGLQIFDNDGLTIRLNKSQMKIIGIANEKFAIGKFNILTDPFSVSNGSAEFFKKVYNTKKAKNRELTADFSTADKKYTTVQKKVHLKEYVFPILDEKKNLLSVASLLQDISYEWESELKLRESEEQFRSTVENSPLGMHIYELDENGNLIFSGANSAADKLLKIDNQQFIGKTVEEAFPSLVDTEVPKRYKAAAEKGKVWHTEQIAYDDDKITGAFEVYAFGIKPGSMAVKFLDITERKRAEEALKTALRLNQMIEDYSEDEIIREGLEAGERLTGSQISYFHFVNPDQKTLSLQMWSKNTLNYCTAAPKGEHYAIDQAGVWVDCIHKKKPVIHNDYESLSHKKGLPEGHTPVLRDLAVPIFEKDKIVAVIGVGNKQDDYTQFDMDQLTLIAETTWSVVQRKRAEEARRTSEERYRTLFETMAHGVVYQNETGTIISANPAAERILGVTLDQMQRRTSHGYTMAIN